MNKKSRYRNVKINRNHILYLDKNPDIKMNKKQYLEMDINHILYLD